MANSKDNINKYATSFIGFEELSGDVYDSIGSTAGTLYGNASRIEGWNGEGYAMNFNGTSQYVDFISKFIPIGEKSIRFKVKVASKPTDTIRILSCARNTNENGLVSAILNDGTIYFRIYDGNTDDLLLVISTIDVCDNQWHDILFTWDGTTDADSVKLYVDDMVTPNAVSTALREETTISTYNVRVGAINGTAGFYFKGQLDSIEIYNTIISGISDKYLVLHNNEYKYHDGTAWQATTATEENFKLFGMEQLSQITEVQWDELGEDVSIVMWSDFEDKQYVNVVLDRDEFTPKELIGDEYSVVVMKEDNVEQQQLFLDAIGLSQTVYPVSDISLLGVKEVTSVEINATGNGRIAISVDSGATWNAFDGNDWLTIVDISQGMTFEQFNNLTIEQIESLLSESKFIRFAYYLTGDTEISEIIMKVSIEGTPEFANKNDYDLSYDINTKTITYVINKSGEYIINYADTE